MVIDCPACDQAFEADFDSTGFCECPHCGTGMTVLSSPSTELCTTEFEECYLETALIVEELKSIEDNHLEDEIAQEMAVGTYMKGTEKIFEEMSASGFMAFDTRKMAEGVYILMHSKMKFVGFKNEYH